jgi:hypothetical protein
MASNKVIMRLKTLLNAAVFFLKFLTRSYKLFKMKRKLVYKKLNKNKKLNYLKNKEKGAKKIKPFTLFCLC